MMEARTTEWEKYKSFNAAIPIWGKELQNLLDEGHKVIPLKWVETDKNEHLKGTPEYSPKMKARLVICGNFEDVSREDVRCDAPTAQMCLQKRVCSAGSPSMVQWMQVEVSTCAWIQK